MWIWNLNEHPSIADMSMKTVTIQYSLTGSTTNPAEWTTIFSGDLTRSYVDMDTQSYDMSDIIGFGGVTAQYVVVTAAVEPDHSYWYVNQGTTNNDTGLGAARFYSSGYAFTGDLNGNVQILDYIFASSPVAVRIELMQGGSVLRTENVILDANGNYSIANVSPDTYDVAFKAMSTLRKVVTGVTVPFGGAGTANVTLINGDLGGDNQITNTDINVVLQHIDTLGD